MPDTLYCRLKYSSNRVLGSFYDTSLFSLNGIFDPDITFTGHQPMGFDQWTNFYDDYEVSASSIKIWLYNDGLIEYVACLLPSTTSVPPTNITAAIEQPYVKQRVIASSAAQQTVTLSNRMSVRKLNGRNTYSVNYTGSSGANPANEQFWHVITGSVDGVSTVTSTMRVELVYNVKWYHRKTLSQS